MHSTASVSVPGCHVSPQYAAGECDPENEQAACLLRPYVPVAALLAINAIVKEECAEADRRSVEHAGVAAAISSTKEQMRTLRLKLKTLEAQSAAYFARPLFHRSDAARAAAWRVAREARAAAIARGETPLQETGAETAVRMRQIAAV